MSLENFRTVCQRNLQTKTNNTQLVKHELNQDSGNLVIFCLSRVLCSDCQQVCYFLQVCWFCFLSFMSTSGLINHPLCCFSFISFLTLQVCNFISVALCQNIYSHFFVPSQIFHLSHLHSFSNFFLYQTNFFL